MQLVSEKNIDLNDRIIGSEVARFSIIRLGSCKGSSGLTTRGAVKGLGGPKTPK